MDSDIRIGIDLGGTKIEGIAIDKRGRELERVRIATPQGNYMGTVEGIAKVVAQIEQKIECTAQVGLGTPGAVSCVTGKLKNANSTCLNGQNFVHDVEQALARKIRIANDADCFTLSEAVDGAGKDHDIVFGVILGTGVGGGIVVNKKLLHGPNVITGEWGHNPLPVSAKRITKQAEHEHRTCYCGQQDCIETYLAGPGLAKSYLFQTGEHISTKTIVEYAQSGDADALEVLQAYCQQLAAALSLIVNILDPHCIVLGGGLSNIAELYSSVPTLWEETIFTDKVLSKLVKNHHGDSSGVRGAAWL